MPKDPIFPSQQQDRFIIRLPDGMRERIRQSAERNGRSMNAEIVQALEHFFPPEPTVEDVLDRVHTALNLAESARGMPYRQVLINALDGFAERVARGLEFGQFPNRTGLGHASDLSSFIDRMERWKRAQEYGVEQGDLERELERGMLADLSRDYTQAALLHFKRGRHPAAMKLLRLEHVKFAEPNAAYAAIEADLRRRYEHRWGNPDETYDPDGG